MSTYNVTVDKAYKLIEAFPSKLMYIAAVPEANELLERFIKPLQSSGFNVVSVAKNKAALQNKINKATSPTIIYGYLQQAELDEIFGQHHFSIILLYFNSHTLPTQLPEANHKSILKSTKALYDLYLETYDRLLVVLF